MSHCLLVSCTCDVKVNQLTSSTSAASRLSQSAAAWMASKDWCTANRHFLMSATQHLDLMGKHANRPTLVLEEGLESVEILVGGERVESSLDDCELALSPSQDGPRSR